jgi:glycosyltransferase involved in cell wall biosynthesis
VVVMDCDLQDRPEEIPRLYAKAREGHEIVVARRGRRSDPLFKRLSSWLYYRVFSWLADMDYDPQAGNYRMLSRKVIANYRNMRERSRFFGSLISWMGFPASSIDVQHDGRFDGNSTYTFAKLWQLGAETIIAYSDKPLRLAIRLGFFIALCAFLYGLYIIFLALFRGSPVTGWSSLIVSVYFMGGVIIAILGILGIYLGKTYDEAKQRPLYVINHTTFDERPKPD